MSSFAQLTKISDFFRPRLSELIDGMLEYVTTEADVAAFDGGSPFAVSLITGLESILNNYTPSLLPTNCDTLVAEVAEDLAGLIEEAAFRTTFNRLGGILFDKDIRVICDYLTSLTEWSLRGKFARCSQMATLLCVESLGEVQECVLSCCLVLVCPSSLTSSWRSQVLLGHSIGRGRREIDPRPSQGFNALS